MRVIRALARPSIDGSWLRSRETMWWPIWQLTSVVTAVYPSLRRARMRFAHISHSTEIMPWMLWMKHGMNFLLDTAACVLLRKLWRQRRQSLSAGKISFRVRLVGAQITIAHFSSKIFLTLSETSGSRALRKLPIAAPFSLSLK